MTEIFNYHSDITMARKNQRERQKKVEDLEDVSADSEPEQDMDASEVKKVTSGNKGNIR